MPNLLKRVRKLQRELIHSSLTHLEYDERQEWVNVNKRFRTGELRYSSAEVAAESIITKGWKRKTAVRFLESLKLPSESLSDEQATAVCAIRNKITWGCSKEKFKDYYKQAAEIVKGKNE